MVLHPSKLSICPMAEMGKKEDILKLKEGNYKDFNDEPLTIDYVQESVNKLKIKI